MIERIVKMTFKPENTDVFEQIFKDVLSRIQNFEGCSSVKLLKDENNPSIYFTYSIWENENYLNNYRNSDFFNDTWGKTKVLFSEKPQAWSVSEIYVSKN